MKPFLIIQNDAQEGAGYLQVLINQRGSLTCTYPGWEANYTHLTTDAFCALIVLGGAQSVYETDKYSYLIDEIQLVKDFINSGKPVIGLCLGAQILATALGGEVKANTQKEIGWFEIQLSEHAKTDDVMNEHPQTAMAYHFHGDFFKLPPDCVSLAKSELTECQLFRYKQNVYGFQYHAEVDLALIEVMCLSNADYMKTNGYDVKDVIAESKKQFIEYNNRCETLLNKWIDKAKL